MLILLTVLVIAAAIVIFTKRRLGSRQIEEPFIPENPNLRPLFQPDEAELRALAAADAKRESEIKNLREKREFEQLLGELDSEWNSDPSRRTAAEFLRVSAQGSDAAAFARTAKKIIQAWRQDRTDITARELADLLDSHFRLLPQQERTSGAIFELREEIEAIRREVRGN